MEKTKKKTIEQYGIREGSPMRALQGVARGLWQEGFKKRVSFEFRMEKE